MGSKALHLVTRQKKYIVGGILKLKNAMVNMRLLWTIQANLDLRNVFKREQSCKLALLGITFVLPPFSRNFVCHPFSS